VAGVTGEASPYHAGFLLGPRINAGGRIGKSNLGARLLTTTDVEEARGIAEQLDQLNAERRAVEAEVLDGAVAQIEAAGIDEDAPILIAAGDHWHPGVIGIAAGRVKERFNRPTIVIGIDPETGLAKGSGRSCPGVDLGSAVSSAREAGLLIAGGGHAMACGLTVEAARIDALRNYLTQALAHSWKAADEARQYTVDAVVHPAAVNFDFASSLNAAAPFGQGNPEPRFAFCDLRRTFAQRVGADHVRFTFEAQSGDRLNGIAFRCADDAMGQALLASGEARFHAAGRLKADDSKYGRRADFHLEDMARAD
jgi:single-stranded-DNA-specific exonuclease